MQGTEQQRGWWSEQRRDWLVAGLWVGLILVTVPVVRRLQELIEGRLGSGIFLTGSLVVIGVAALAVAVLGRQLRGSLPIGSMAWLAGIVLVCWWWGRHLLKPVEAVHFIEYGVLGVLLFRALRHRISDAAVLVAATIAGTMVGLVDEVVQWLVPTRIYDLRDIWVNAGAVAMAQVALWQGLRPAVSRRLPTAASLRLVCRLVMVLVVLVGGCLSCTPSRVDRLAQVVPYLGTCEEMSEYGHRLRLPGIGELQSRFTLAELQRLDRERADEVAEVISRFRQPERYAGFLAAYTPVRAPFVHELRVHLFSRNRNLQLADAHRDDAIQYRRHLTVASRENQLLETVFPVTLQRAGARISEHRRQQLRQGMDSTMPFTSRVSAHLITAFSEGQMRLALVAILMLLVLTDRLLAARERRDGAIDR